MQVCDGRITLSAAEWEEFARATFAPWMPRTIAEFNAMCALGSARHLAEDTGGEGFMHALAAEGMQFGPQGELNFPLDPRKLAYLKAHGEWPGETEVIGFEPPRAGTVVH